MKPSRFILSPDIVDTYDNFCSLQIGYISALNQLSVALKAYVVREQLLSCAVLEIGSGTGECTQRILESIPSAQITAIDNDASFQQKAKKKLGARFGRSSIEFQLSDAFEFLKKAIQSRKIWDLVVAGFTLHNWEHDYRSKVLQNIFRIIRPGGSFIILDYFPENKAVASEAFTEHIAWLEMTLKSPNQSVLRSFWVSHTLDDISPRRIMYKAPTISELKQLGFCSVKSHRIAKLEALISVRKSVVEPTLFERNPHQ